MWHSWFDSIVFGIKATLKVFPVDAIYYAFLIALFIYCASSPFTRSLLYADSFAFIVIPSVLWYDSDIADIFQRFQWDWFSPAFALIIHYQL